MSQICRHGSITDLSLIVNRYAMESDSATEDNTNNTTNVNIRRNSSNDSNGASSTGATNDAQMGMVEESITVNSSTGSSGNITPKPERDLYPLLRRCAGTASRISSHGACPRVRFTGNSSIGNITPKPTYSK